MKKVTRQLLLVLRMMANEMLRTDCRGYKILCDCFVSGRHDVWRVSVHHHACMFHDAFLFLTAYMYNSMFTIIYTTTGGDDQSLCNGESDPQEDFCTGSAVDSYLNMYAVSFLSLELSALTRPQELTSCLCLRAVYRC